MVAQVAQHLGREIYAFTRPGDTRAQAFARRIGAVWAGDSNTLHPHVVRYPLDEANRALDDLRAGRFDGTAVLAMH